MIGSVTHTKGVELKTLQKIYMDDKPIVKKYYFDSDTIIMRQFKIIDDMYYYSFYDIKAQRYFDNACNINIPKRYRILLCLWEVTQHGNADDVITKHMFYLKIL